MHDSFAPSRTTSSLLTIVRCVRLSSTIPNCLIRPKETENQRQDLQTLLCKSAASRVRYRDELEHMLLDLKTLMNLIRYYLDNMREIPIGTTKC